uniref:BEN domain-containing protein n=1 Tax=Heliothis virescens TaxID=7102 RepID=A0A2A4K9J5_HELVI
MEQQYKAFVVIKVLNQSNPDLDKYVCLPSTWIKVKDSHNDNVVFGYPSEPRVVTMTRVNEYQPLDKTWPSLYGEVIHDTENKKSNTTLEQEKPSSKKMKRKKLESDDVPPNIFQAKSKIIGNEIDEKFELQISKIFEMIRSRKVTLESNDDRSESPISSSLSENSETEECGSLSNDMENIVTAKKLADIEATDNRTTSRKLSRPRKPEGYYFGIGNCHYFDDSSDSDYVSHEPNYKNKSSLKVGRPKRKVSESGRSNKSEPTDIDDVVDISNTTQSLMTDEVYNQCNNFCTEFNESYQKTMSILDNAANYFQQVIKEHERSAKVSKQKSRDCKKRRKNISETEPQLLDTSRCNTKWTLKHPEPGPGLVELVPHTGVYVNEEVLIESRETFQDATKFARALLEDIFTQEALHVCSFTGSFPKRGKKCNLQGRPGLDVNARETLISYAKEYGTEKNMRYADVVSITNSIKNKLQKYRQ